MRTLLTQLSFMGLMLAGCALKAQDPASPKTPASVGDQTPPGPTFPSGDPQTGPTQTPATSAPSIPAVADPLPAPFANIPAPQSVSQKFMD
jgi:hypothetical protein